MSDKGANCLREGTAEEFDAELTVNMAGRAAERLVLGSVSAGAGGGPESNLAQASRLVLELDRQAGLGVNGAAWLGDPDFLRLTDAERNRIRAKLDQAERRATHLLEPRRDQLEALAAELVRRRELDQEALAPWLEPPAAMPTVPDG